MSQPFSKRSNSLSRLSILISIILVVGSFALGETLVRSGYHTGTGEEVLQPIAFSHKHHVQGLGLDCRFCHIGVEKNASAGYPDTKTCMTCHSQIWKSEKILEPVRKSFADSVPLEWKKVHRLPDYVYFNHSIHIQKGVACVTCHGEVSQMAAVKQVRNFFMKDCMECHTNPSRFIRPREEVFNEHWISDPSLLVRDHLMKMNGVHPQRLTDCTRCHT